VTVRSGIFTRQTTNPAEQRRSAELEAEVASLRQQLGEWAQQAQENAQILARMQERELALLRADTLAELLRQLVEGLANSFEIPCVTVALWDPHHEIRHLLVGSGERLQDHPSVLFADNLIALAPQFASLHQPWLGPYDQHDHAALMRGAARLGSIAIIPLARQERLIGSVNLGSGDASRFTRRHATEFLAHLGVIAALCLENAVNQARLLRSGFTDFLTGWHNRRYLHARLKEELARAQRRGGTVACLMVDLDHFKRVNDSYGHLVGDQVLREVAQRIDGEIRESDAAARFGGDEFAILMPDTDAAQAQRVAQRVLHAVCASPVSVNSPSSESIKVTLSIGIAAIQPQRSDQDLKALADRLLAEADAGLYRAKSGGRQRIEAAVG
jgi:two-component system cell cycle response regulator